jgi:hypothetical protein
MNELLVAFLAGVFTVFLGMVFSAILLSKSLLHDTRLFKSLNVMITKREELIIGLINYTNQEHKAPLTKVLEEHDTKIPAHLPESVIDGNYDNQ